MELVRFRLVPPLVSPLALLAVGVSSGVVGLSARLLLAAFTGCPFGWLCCDSVDSLRYFSRSDASCEGDDDVAVSATMAWLAVRRGARRRQQRRKGPDKPRESDKLAGVRREDGRNRREL